MSILSRLYPFILAGIVIVAFSFGVLLLAYLFLIGATIGLILFIFSWIRDRFFTSRHRHKQPPKRGRIIDSDDWRRLR